MPVSTRPPCIIILSLLGLLIWPVLSQAVEPGARLIGLQMPAWVDRNGGSIPARPGMALASSDRIRTGSNSRALLRLEEGSLVKLGENGSLELNRLQPPAEPEGVFKAALRVLRGAFRFTTRAVSARKRSVDVTIGTVTAGIRGTDIWGKSTTDKDIVCLIEGDIQVAKQGYTPVSMSDPLSFYVAPSEGDPKPVAPVPDETLKSWIPQTELMEGAGVLRDTGGWQLNLASFRHRKHAQAALNELAKAGYGAHLQTVVLGQTTWHRLRISGFVSQRDANSFADRIGHRFGAGTPWISHSGT